MSKTRNALAGRRIAAATLVSVTLLTLLPGCVAQGSAPGSIAEGAIITIDASKPAGPTISRSIFGSFLEPIGHSTYGGLWAELLENGSLEENLWSAGAIARMVQERPELI